MRRIPHTLIAFVLAIIMVLLLVFGNSANAQPPLDIGAHVFIRLGAEVAPCADAAVVLNEDLSTFSPVYCGVIGDTLTDINKRWTVEKLQSYGYNYTAPWRLSYARNTFEMHIAGFTKPRAQSLIVAIAVVNDFTVIIMGFGR